MIFADPLRSIIVFPLMFPPAVAPEPHVGIAANDIFEKAYISMGELAFGEAGGLAGAEFQGRMIVAPAGFFYIGEDDGQPAAAGSFFRPGDKGRGMPEKTLEPRTRWAHGSVVACRAVRPASYLLVGTPLPPSAPMTGAVRRGVKRVDIT